MGRHGRAKPLSQINFPPWATASNTNTERIGYAKLGTSLLQNTPFKALRSSSQILYVQLVSYAAGKEKFHLSSRRAEKLFGMTRPTYLDAIRQLINEGFLTEMYTDSLGQYETRQYRFCSEWKTKLTDEEKVRFQENSR